MAFHRRSSPLHNFLHLFPAPLTAFPVPVASALTTEATAQSAKFDQFTDTSHKAGETAPDFTLMTLKGGQLNLMEVAAERPAVIEFGSFS